MFASCYADAPTTSTRHPAAGQPLLFTQLGGLNIVSRGNGTGSVMLRTLNRFYTRMGQDNDNIYSSPYDCLWQISIGSVVSPVMPSRSLSESFYRLKGALGILPSSFHAIDINYFEYRDTHFVIGIDLEKVTDAACSGLRTKAGNFVSAKIN